MSEWEMKKNGCPGLWKGNISQEDPEVRNVAQWGWGACTPWLQRKGLTFSEAASFQSLCPNVLSRVPLSGRSCWLSLQEQRSREDGLAVCQISPKFTLVSSFRLAPTACRGRGTSAWSEQAPFRKGLPRHLPPEWHIPSCCWSTAVEVSTGTSGLLWAAGRDMSGSWIRCASFMPMIVESWHSLHAHQNPGMLLLIDPEVNTE